MKKKLLVFAFIALCLSIIAYGTTAYFTYEEKTTNIISTGGISIDIQEWAVSEDGSYTKFDGAIGVMPGAEVSKIVEIKNTCEQPVWVRISVEKTIILADGATEGVDLSLISLDLNTSDWTELDGYYYYNSQLLPGETTKPLFTKVIFADTMSNMYQSSTAVIDITAQATQVIHNGDNIFEANGWPEK